MHTYRQRWGLIWLGLLALAGCRPASELPDRAMSLQSAVGSRGAAWEPEGAVPPTAESIATGRYVPLSRPLFLYVNVQSLKRPEVSAFLRYHLSAPGRQLIEEARAIPLPDPLYDEQLEQLNAAISRMQPPAIERLRGQVSINGSSTVSPLCIAVAEEFCREHRTVRASIGRKGTSGGFKLFCNGEIDICPASREIAESEEQLCRKNGVEYLPLTVAYDGITVAVHPENDWVNGLTVSELKRIWAPAGDVRKWSDIRPEFPDAEIRLFGPDTDSGTFEYFTEAVCGRTGDSRSDYQQNSNDNFLVTGIAGDRLALGYFGFSFFIENRGQLKALSIAQD